MTTPEQLFFQSIKAGGKTIPIYNLVSGAYVESIELNGPQLQFTFTDVDSALADDHKLREGAELDVRMGDPGNDSRGVYFASKFVVVSAVPNGDHLLVSAIEAGVYAVKQPSPRPLVFNQMTPSEILTQLFPGYKIGDNASQERVTYHVPMGVPPSLTLRQMAKELGCALWVARGVVYCIPYQALMTRQRKDGQIRLEYQGDVRKVRYGILAYEPIYVAVGAAREEKRQYMTWDTVEGLQISAINEGCPRVFLPVANINALDASVWRFVDRMQADLTGCGIFEAGVAVSVRINRVSTESVIDESLPLVQVFRTVSHIQTPNNYRCIATTGITEGGDS